MALDPHATQRVHQHINNFWKGCPMCGFRQWQALGYSMVQVSATGAVSWGVSGVPVVALACGQCGFVAHITKAAVGL